jgi:hypothetical protein
MVEAAGPVVFHAPDSGPSSLPRVAQILISSWVIHASGKCSTAAVYGTARGPMLLYWRDPAKRRVMLPSGVQRLALIMQIGFEWDEKKAGSNVRKHRISFDEAVTVFDDPMALTLNDPDHVRGRTPICHDRLLEPRAIIDRLPLRRSRLHPPD